MNRQQLHTAAPPPSMHDETRAAFTAGWWNGKLVGFVLGLATAVLLGWLR